MLHFVNNGQVLPKPVAPLDTPSGISPSQLVPILTDTGYSEKAQNSTTPEHTCLVLCLSFGISFVSLRHRTPVLDQRKFIAELTVGLTSVMPLPSLDCSFLLTSSGGDRCHLPSSGDNFL